MIQAIPLVRLCSFHIHTVRLDGNHLSDRCLKALADELRHQELKELSIRDCGITATPESSLFELLNVLRRTVQILDLSINCLGQPFL
jgi:hypothetical protein